MSKAKLIEQLKEYFTEKGKFLNYVEYTQAEDAPFRAQIVKRHVGTWARLERLIGEIQPKSESKPEPKPAVKPAPVKK